jgi:hypothetical protein
MKICSGCGTKIPDAHRGRCAACQADSGNQNYDADGIKVHAPVGATPARDKYAHLYKSPRWTTCSRIQRQRFPMCETPGCHAFADIADHFIPAAIYIEMCRESRKFLIAEGAFFDMQNLQSLCNSHHRLKTLEDDQHIALGGPWAELGRLKKVYTF